MQFSLDDLKNIDIEKLNHFYLVFKTRSTKEASAKYNIALPVLRHSLKTIEKKLNIKLSHASKKAFYPTDAAMDLFELCSDLINLINNHKNKIDLKLEKEIKRELVIVTTTTLAHFFLPEILEAFAKKHPLVSVKVYAGPEYVNNREFAFDLLLAGNLGDGDLIKKKFRTFHYHFYCSSKLYNTLKHLKTPMDIQGQNLLLFAGEHFLEDGFIKNNNVKFISNSYPFLINMCHMGCGIISSIDFNSLNKLYKNFDLVPLFENHVTEVDDAYLYFSRHSAKIDLIEDLERIIFSSISYDQ